MATTTATLREAAIRQEALRHRSLWRDAWDSARRNPFAVGGAIIVIFFVVAALIGPLVTPYDYRAQDLMHTEQGPSWDHWFGTDELGRDFLSRILYGARTAFLVATMVTVIGGTLGILLGATAALSERWVGGAIMRLTDVVLAFPHLLLATFANATFRPRVQEWIGAAHDSTGLGFFNSKLLGDYLVVFSSLALVSWPGLARLVRGQVLGLKHAEFVEAARVNGATQRWIITRHIVPNILGAVIVSLTVGFGAAMLLESALSYLGVGIQPPGASWGAMINENLAMWRYKPHLVLVPGGVLAVVIFAFNFFGDGLNDALNPRNRRR
ncbi:MAG TPA: ABC transporter permease [Thermomicrobiales bacterium]|nr:ABC transporter permease [Thermomicrobiales bacterium]